jgi:hypothetical protein
LPPRNNTTVITALATYRAKAPQRSANSEDQREDRVDTTKLKITFYVFGNKNGLTFCIRLIHVGCRLLRLSADGDADWFAPRADALLAHAVDGAGRRSWWRVSIR